MIKRRPLLISIAILPLLLLRVYAAEPSATVVSGFHPEAGVSRDVLTNEGVVALADAGYSPQFIRQRVRVAPRTQFDTTVEGLTYLRRSGVPEELVEFMIDPAGQSRPVAGSSAVMPAAPAMVLAGERRTRKIVVRIPRIPEPTPLVYLYYPNSGAAAAAAALPAMPNIAPAQRVMVAAAPVPVTSNKSWWR